MKGTLDDLPGLANRYLLYNPKGDLQMVYGIIPKNVLDDLGISGVNAGESYQKLRAKLREGITEGMTEDEVNQMIR